MWTYEEVMPISVNTTLAVKTYRCLTSSNTLPGTGSHANAIGVVNREMVSTNV